MPSSTSISSTFASPASPMAGGVTRYSRPYWSETISRPWPSAVRPLVPRGRCQDVVRGEGGVDVRGRVVAEGEEQRRGAVRGAGVEGDAVAQRGEAVLEAGAQAQLVVADVCVGGDQPIPTGASPRGQGRDQVDRRRDAGETNALIGRNR